MLLEEFPFEPGFRLADGDLLNKVAAEPAYSVDNSVSATGTTQSTAYGIRATVTVVTGGGDQTGLKLPAPKVGRMLYVGNYTATGKKIYPYDQELINGSASASLAFNMGAMLVCTSQSSWVLSQQSTASSGDVVVGGSDASTAISAGHFVELSAGNGGITSGDGGAVLLVSGNGLGTPGDGGDITLQGGTSAHGRGGDIFLRVGTGTPNGVVSVVGALALSTGLAAFGGTAPATKPVVSGSRGGNAALASLITALASYGLVTDSTTA